MGQDQPKRHGIGRWAHVNIHKVINCESSTSHTSKIEWHCCINLLSSRGPQKLEWVQPAQWEECIRLSNWFCFMSYVGRERPCVCLCVSVQSVCALQTEPFDQQIPNWLDFLIQSPWRLLSIYNSGPMVRHYALMYFNLFTAWEDAIWFSNNIWERMEAIH